MLSKRNTELKTLCHKKATRNTYFPFLSVSIIILFFDSCSCINITWRWLIMSWYAKNWKLLRKKIGIELCSFKMEYMSMKKFVISITLDSQTIQSSANEIDEDSINKMPSHVHKHHTLGSKFTTNVNESHCTANFYL